MRTYCLFLCVLFLAFVRVHFLAEVYGCQLFLPLVFFLSSCSFAIFSSPLLRHVPLVFLPPSWSLVPLRHEKEVHVTFCHRLVPFWLCGWLHLPKRIPRIIERDKGNEANEQLGNDRKSQGTHLLLWILVLVLVGVYGSVARKDKNNNNNN